MSSLTDKVISIYKHEGESPLDAIEKWRSLNPAHANSSLGYAGRLDPMAHGLLLVLVDDENLKRKEYERLSKTYEFEVLFGVSTDTYDILGKVTSSEYRILKEEDIRRLIPLYLGKQTQPYPPYSSPRINGKPLFWWARENRLAEITIPEKEIDIYTLDLLKMITISPSNLREDIVKRVTNVKGDFRQNEILESWRKFFETTSGNFQLASFRMTCSSGTYVRSLAHTLGIQLGCGALAYSINRTQIGESYKMLQ